MEPLRALADATTNWVDAPPHPAMSKWTAAQSHSGLLMGRFHLPDGLSLLGSWDRCRRSPGTFDHLPRRFQCHDRQEEHHETHHAEIADAPLEFISVEGARRLDAFPCAHQER